MAEGKNKIIVYRDWITTFDSLNDDEAGRLIKHFFRYINDLNPEPPDRLTGLLFEPIKQTLKRDLKMYEAICLKNKDNVNIRWNKDNTTEYDRIRTDTKHTDSDSDKDIDTDSDKDKKNKKKKSFIAPTIDEVVAYFVENKYTKEAGQKAYNYYSVANWRDSNGKPVLNWKQKMINVWFKPENEDTSKKMPA
jgi:hypothetical protein